LQDGGAGVGGVNAGGGGPHSRLANATAAVTTSPLSMMRLQGHLDQKDNRQWN